MNGYHILGGGGGGGPHSWKGGMGNGPYWWPYGIPWWAYPQQPEPVFEPLLGTAPTFPPYHVPQWTFQQRPELWAYQSPDLYMSIPQYVGPIEEIDGVPPGATADAGAAVAPPIPMPLSPWGSGAADDQGPPAAAAPKKTEKANAPVRDSYTPPAVVRESFAQPTAVQKTVDAVKGMPTWQKVLAGVLAGVAVVAVGGGVVAAVRR